MDSYLQPFDNNNRFVIYKPIFETIPLQSQAKQQVRGKEKPNKWVNRLYKVQKNEPAKTNVKPKLSNYNSN